MGASLGQKEGQGGRDQKSRRNFQWELTIEKWSWGWEKGVPGRETAWAKVWRERELGQFGVEQGCP